MYRAYVMPGSLVTLERGNPFPTYKETIEGTDPMEREARAWSVLQNAIDGGHLKTPGEYLVVVPAGDFCYVKKFEVAERPNPKLYIKPRGS